MQSLGLDAMSSLNFSCCKNQDDFILYCAVRSSLAMLPALSWAGRQIPVLGNLCMVSFVQLYLWELQILCQAVILQWWYSLPRKPRKQSLYGKHHSSASAGKRLMEELLLVLLLTHKADQCVSGRDLHKIISPQLFGALSVLQWEQILPLLIRLTSPGYQLGFSTVRSAGSLVL